MFSAYFKIVPSLLILNQETLVRFLEGKPRNVWGLPNHGPPEHFNSHGRPRLASSGWSVCSISSCRWPQRLVLGLSPSLR